MSTARSRHEKANLSDRKQRSPECATDRDQSQSSMQAIGQVARCTIRLVSYAGASHPALDNTTRIPWFMVRVRFRTKLAASIERTSNIKLCLLLADAHIKRSSSLITERQ